MIHDSLDHDIDRIGITEEAVTAIPGRRLMSMLTDADKGKAAGSNGSRPNPQARKSAESTGSGSKGRQWRRLWIPDQIGGWAMALMPGLAGLLIGGPTWRGLLLMVAWAFCYCFEFTGSRWMVSHRAARFAPPALGYALLTAVTGLILLVGTPGLLRWAPLYLVLGVLNFAAAWMRAERSWWNDTVVVIAACTLCLIAVSLGSRFQKPGPGLEGANAGYFGCQPNPAVDCFASGFLPSAALPSIGVVSAAVFAVTQFGSVIFVKTMIRERGKTWCYLLSLAWNLALCLIGVAMVHTAGWWPLLTALVLLIRAALLPAISRRRRIPILYVGLVECATSLLVFILVIAQADVMTASLTSLLGA